MGRQSAPTEPVSGSDVRMHGLAPAAQPSSASSNGLGRERSLCTTTAGPRDGARSKVFYRRRGDRAVQIAGSSGSIDGLPRAPVSLRSQSVSEKDPEDADALWEGPLRYSRRVHSVWVRRAGKRQHSCDKVLDHVLHHPAA